MSDDHTDSGSETGPHQKQQRKRKGQSSAVAWLGLLIATVSFFVGLSGHWKDWYVMVAWPIALILAGFALNDLLHKHTKWSSDNILLFSFWIPYFVGVAITVAYAKNWKEPVPGPTASEGDNLQNLNVFPDAKLRQDVRSFIEALSPDFLKLVDTGRPEVGIFLGSTSQVRLALLAQKPGFDKLLTYKPGTSTITGSSNRIGDYLNEIGEEGPMTLFFFYPKDALRKDTDK